jgi:hypothetical protein
VAAHIRELRSEKCVCRTVKLDGDSGRTAVDCAWETHVNDRDTTQGHPWHVLVSDTHVTDPQRLLPTYTRWAWDTGPTPGSTGTPKCSPLMASTPDPRPRMEESPSGVTAVSTGVLYNRGPPGVDGGSHMGQIEYTRAREGGTEGVRDAGGKQDKGGWEVKRGRSSTQGQERVGRRE